MSDSGNVSETKIKLCMHRNAVPFSPVYLIDVQWVWIDFSVWINLHTEVLAALCSTLPLWPQHHREWPLVPPPQRPCPGPALSLTCSVTVPHTAACLFRWSATRGVYCMWEGCGLSWIQRMWMQPWAWSTNTQYVMWLVATGLYTFIHPI